MEWVAVNGELWAREERGAWKARVWFDLETWRWAVIMRGGLRPEDRRDGQAHDHGHACRLAREVLEGAGML